MFQDRLTRDELLGLLKMPALRKKTAVAYVNVNPQSGLTAIRGKHVDLWMYASFDPVQNIAAVVGIDSYGL